MKRGTREREREREERGFWAERDQLGKREREREPTSGIREERTGNDERRKKKEKEEEGKGKCQILRFSAPCK